MSAAALYQEEWSVRVPQKGKIGGFEVVGTDGLIAMMSHHPNRQKEAEANAYAISANRELLAALIECVRIYEVHRDAQPTGHLWPDPNYIFNARAAIAKATNQSKS